MQKMLLENDNRGVMSVEMSIIIPIIIMTIIIFINIFLSITDRELIRKDMYEKIYTLSVIEQEKDRVHESLEPNNRTNWLICESLYMKEPDTAAVYSKLSSNSTGMGVEIEAMTEIEMVGERLRRWKFYGDISDK